MDVSRWRVGQVADEVFSYSLMLGTMNVTVNIVSLEAQELEHEMCLLQVDLLLRFV